MTSGIEELRAREYWTPPEAARVLGRGCAYWRAASLAEAEAHR